jgi:AcrR family transcriptional regulator
MVKRDLILATALRMFAEKGFASTSTLALAREAGVAEGTIFRHFEGKEAIFSEILAALHQKIKSDFESEMALVGGGSGLLDMQRGIASFLAFCAANRDYLTLFFSDAPARYIEQNSPVFREIYSIYRYITGFLVGQAIKGQTDGSVRRDIDVESITITLACSIIGLARARHFGLVDSSQVYVDQLLDCIARILKP